MIPLVKRAEREEAVTSTLSDTERPLRTDARRIHERILESARAVFAETGAEAQIDDVACYAGVGAGRAEARRDTAST
jgi:AcrR family transcriptional regulator